MIKANGFVNSRNLIVVSLILFIYGMQAMIGPPNLAVATDWFYPLLTKGFLHGSLSLPVKITEHLTHYPDSTCPLTENLCRAMFGASYFHRKFFLYFGPLPLLLTIPFALITGKLILEQWILFIFLSIGFITTFYLLSCIRSKFLPSISTTQLLFSGLIIGISNNALFLLERPAVYETAIGSAYCLMCFAIFFLYKIFVNQCRPRDAFLFGLCLGLSVAGRPNLILLWFALVPLLIGYFFYQAPKKQFFSLLISLTSPLIFIAILLASYNYARFGSFTEFGVTYQITDIINSFPISYHFWKTGLYYYLFNYSYPFYEILPAHTPTFAVKHILTYPFGYSQYLSYTKGILMFAPVALLALLIPFGLAHIKKSAAPLFWFITFLLFVPAITMLFYISFPGISQRYETDFLPYIILIAILSAWLFQQTAYPSIVKKAVQSLFIITGMASLLLSFWI